MKTRVDRPPSDAGGTEPRPEPAPALSYRIWLRRRDQVTVAVLMAAALILLSVYWLRMSGWGSEPIEINRLPQHVLDYKIDVNAANWVEWCQLPEIGETLARRIVEDREQNGPFRSIDELNRVSGLGPKTIEQIRPYLQEIAPPETTSESASGQHKAGSTP